MVDVSEPTGDLFRARRLAELFAGVLRYVPGAGWFAFDGRRWAMREQASAIAFRHMHELSDVFYEESVRLDKSGDEVAAQARWKCARSLQTLYGLNGCERVARALAEFAASAEDFDARPELFNAANGTVNLRTGEVRSHAAPDLLTCLSPTDYVPGAPCPTWLAYLDAVFAGPHCAALVGYFQRLLGYAMSGETEASVFPVLHGRGSNGKSVVMTAVSEALGSDYAGPVATSVLVGKAASGHTDALASIVRKRMVVASETEQGDRLAAALLKQVTGGESVQVSFKGSSSFDITPRFTLLMETNFLPQVRGDDEGIWRRLRVVPFENTLTAAEWPKRETALRLAAEREGILAWLVDGAVEYYRAGLAEPAAITAVTAKYRAAEDALAGFYPGVYEDDLRAFVPRADVWQVCEVWRSKNGLEPFRSRQTLYRALEERGAVPVKNGVLGFRLRLTPEEA